MPVDACVLAGLPAWPLPARPALARSPALAPLDRHRGMLRWHIHYNLLVLRMLSYSADLHWARLKRPGRPLTSKAAAVPPTLGGHVGRELELRVSRAPGRGSGADRKAVDGWGLERGGCPGLRTCPSSRCRSHGLLLPSVVMAVSRAWTLTPPSSLGAHTAPCLGAGTRRNAPLAWAVRPRALPAVPAVPPAVRRGPHHHIQQLHLAGAGAAARAPYGGAP